MTTLTVEIVGKRAYIRGNTYAVKDRIKDALGTAAHWDGERKAWWTGKTDDAQKLVDELNAAQAAGGQKPEDAAPYGGPVKGKATYKGRTYYVRWSGTTRGVGLNKTHLVTLDGKVSFWADSAEVTWVKAYQPKGRYGRPDPDGDYPTLSGIRHFIERNKRETAETGIDCHACRKAHAEGRLREHLHDGCEACGREG